MAELNGKALSAIAVGSLFLWSGIKGWSVLGTVADIVGGKAPSQTVAVPLTSVKSTSGSRPIGGDSAGHGDIVSEAMQFQGHAYRFGGAPGPDAADPWDCSSFVNYILGVRLKRAIPGYKPGQYTGTVHGPPTGTWGVWTGYTKVPRSETVAGDIVVWLGHMGIATSNTHMISALNPDEGTKVTPIDGYGNGPLLCVGRYNG